MNIPKRFQEDEKTEVMIMGDTMGETGEELAKQLAKQQAVNKLRFNLFIFSIKNPRRL